MAFIPPFYIVRSNGVKKELFKNRDLVCHILSLIDDIRLEIQSITKVNLQLLKEDYILPPLDNRKSPDELANVILCDSSQ